MVNTRPHLLLEVLRDDRGQTGTISEGLRLATAAPARAVLGGDGHGGATAASTAASAWRIAIDRWPVDGGKTGRRPLLQRNAPCWQTARAAGPAARTA